MHDVALTDNIVTDGQTGIYASQADGLTIQGGEVREQTWAIILYGADGARVSGVTISNSSDLADSMGVDVYQSADVTISDTTISGHAYGVSVEGGGSAAVDNNRITANGTGIHVTDGGSLTSVTENFITGNTGDGILITATAGSVAPVFNNDLSGNGGLAVNNQSATTVDAAGNWWGTSTAAGVAAEISGNVDFKPFLVTGEDTDAQGRLPGQPAAAGRLDQRQRAVRQRLRGRRHASSSAARGPTACGSPL